MQALSPIVPALLARETNVAERNRRGFQINIWLSLLAAAGVALLFMAGADWNPSADWQAHADFAVSWILLTYIWIQMGSLILVGASTKHHMWIDALTSLLC